MNVVPYKLQEQLKANARVLLRPCVKVVGAFEMSTTPPTSPPRALAAVRHLDTSASKRKRPHEEMSESPKLSQEGKEEALRFGDTFSVQPQTGETHDNPPLESDKSQELGGAGITEDGPNKKETPDEKLTDEAFDPKQNIPDFDWEEFESRYLTAMAEEDNLQSAIHEEFRTRMNVICAFTWWLGHCILTSIVLRHLGSIGRCARERKGAKAVRTFPIFPALSH